MRKILAPLFAILGLFTTLFAAEAAQTPFRVLTQTANYVDVEFISPELTYTKISQNGTDFIRFDEKYNNTAVTGMPEAPTFGTFLAIPYSGDVSVSILEKDDTYLPEAKLYPYQTELNAESSHYPFFMNEEFYNGYDIFPSASYRVSEPMGMRELRVVNFLAQPVSYDAAKNLITVSKRIVYRVNFVSSREAATMTPPSRISRSYEKLYRSYVLNYEQMRNPSIPYQERTILVVYPYVASQDTQIRAILDYYFAYKKEKGFLVTMVSTEVTGTTNTAIKTYLQNAYNTWENKPEYFIIIGDVSGTISIPNYSVASSGSSDDPYGRLSGGDAIPDVFVGRMSVEDLTGLQTVAAKGISYEQTPNMVDTSMYHRALLVGDPDHSGISTIITSKYIKEMMHNFNPDCQFDEIYGGSFPSLMDQSLNQGVFIFNYRGYIGMSSWTTTNINGLTNTNKLFNAVILTCGTGNFNGTATTESILRAGTANAHKGGITAMGLATSSTHTRFNNILDGGVFYGIYNAGVQTMGEGLAAGKIALVNAYGISAPNDVENFTSWCNLMGDSALDIWTNEPQPLTVSYPYDLSSSANFVEINVVDTPDAWVTITTPGDEIRMTGYTDINGKVDFYLPALEQEYVGPVTVVVTKPNCIPHIGTFNMVEYGAISYQDVTVDDDNEGNSMGNADSIINPDETIEMNVILHNRTNWDLGTFTAELFAEDNNVSILQNQTTMNEATGNSDFTSATPFIYHVSPACPDLHHLNFILVVQNTVGQSWEFRFSKQVSGADLDLTSANILDGADNILNAGETASIQLHLQNIGHIAVDSLYVRLVPRSGMFTVNSPVSYLGSLAVDQTIATTSGDLTITADGGLITGMKIALEAQFYNNAGYFEKERFEIPIGTITQHTPLGPDAYGYFIYDDTDTAFADCPTYQWIEVAPAAGGQGTLIPTADTNDNLDAVNDINLPFPFTFYGVEYTTATLSANGWICLGRTEQAEFRNWPIPGPLGPSPMIAPMWDDLYKTSSGQLVTYYDASNHWFIVEWHNMTNNYNDSSLEKFELIFYDPEYYPTITGDGKIKVQYHTFNNVDSGNNQTGGNYATIGIEDHTGSYGLQYSYNNTYPTAAKPITNNTALMIAPGPRFFTGSHLTFHHAEYINADGYNVITAGSNVYLNAMLNNDGYDAAENVTAVLSSDDEYTQIIHNTVSYATIMEHSVAGSTDRFDIFINPNAPVNHEINLTLTVRLGNQVQGSFPITLTVLAPSVTVSSSMLLDLTENADGILNAGENFVLAFNIENSIPVPSGNLNISLSCSDTDITLNNTEMSINNIAVGKKYQAVFTGSVSSAAAAMPANFILSVTGNAINVEYPVSVAINGESPAFDLVGALKGNVALPVPDRELSDAKLSVGNIFGYPFADGSYYFLLPEGVYTITAALEGCDEATLSNLVVSNLLVTQAPDLQLMSYPVPTGLTATLDANNANLVNLTWDAISHPAFTVYAVYRTLVGGEFALYDTTSANAMSIYEEESGEYSYYVTARYGSYETDPSNTVQINAGAAGDNGIAPVYVTALGGNYPNPFNPVTNISFSLEKDAKVSLDVYNVKGQLVKNLVNDKLPKGKHLVTWSGDNNNGKHVSSGVYFYRLKTGSYEKMKKALLIK